jgi:hypothetical protein
MPSSYKPKYEYSIDEWLRHFDFFFRSPRGSNKDELLLYFETHYHSSASEGFWKMKRFETAFAYLMGHLKDFEQFVVTHERLALVSAPIVIALWRYYGKIPDEHLSDDPDVHLISEMAKEESSSQSLPKN